MEKEQMRKILLKKGERLDVLKRENIEIIQSSSVFSFSLDAVLLADFASVPRVRSAKIVDLCSGNGAVAFLLTGKTNNPVVGIEIQEKLIDMARRTVELNQLEERVTFIHADIKKITDQIRPDSVDVITCNPPYFKDLPTSTKNTNDAFTLARHEILLSLPELMKKSSQLLKMNGHAYFVHRPDRLLDILDSLRNNRLAPKRIQFVYPRMGKDANMILIEAIKDGKEDGLKILPPLYVHDQTGDYSQEVKEILFGE
ncbi:tRNA1(Val) (adenine(37)-N6)-methyltransferase [Jeotgalibaca sp. MA1X17-3]|uniref:tRNA1(Val) (adenine(37)-N6)-methyltransferase n=1 Tax=Jeotgalibaca sp. MA1X17-3 TaxID=2908211 RepID=UPI001F2BAC3E|nr:tRNA1(Val) (adenine(37)-N6)-methyltransferase [Jeotgalibaca sp. MA1X17-3]UJF15883.1 tRNA1(Val) (adenine(37)-N6)-methyltransferase [Jeotgalibaca sp. MA1X17-3]